MNYQCRLKQESDDNESQTSRDLYFFVRYLYLEKVVELLACGAARWLRFCSWRSPNPRADHRMVGRRRGPLEV
jgi:hypothetical protein